MRPSASARAKGVLLAEAHKKRNPPLSGFQPRQGQIEGDFLQDGGLARAGFAQNHKSLVCLHGFGNVFQRARGCLALLHSIFIPRDHEFCKRDRQTLIHLAHIHFASQRHKMRGPALVFLVDA